jgi:hypothetical protein
VPWIFTIYIRTYYVLSPHTYFEKLRIFFEQVGISFFSFERQWNNRELRRRICGSEKEINNDGTGSNSLDVHCASSRKLKSTKAAGFFCFENEVNVDPFTYPTRAGICSAIE